MFSSPSPSTSNMSPSRSLHRQTSSSGDANQRNYLPPYLLGETVSPLPYRSPNFNQRSAASPLSPPAAASTSPVNKLESSFYATSSPFHNKYQTASSTAAPISRAKENDASLLSSPRAKGFPPVESYHHPASPPPTSTQQWLSWQQEKSTPLTPGKNEFVRVLGGNPPVPMSPAQIDPFYTQGESLRSSSQLNAAWITVFGFPPDSASYILDQFSELGNVVHHEMSNSGNWMHVCYDNAIQAKNALSKNGKLLSNGVMVGVQPCIDLKVMGKYEKLDVTTPRPPMPDRTYPERTLSPFTLVSPPPIMPDALPGHPTPLSHSMNGSSSGATQFLQVTSFKDTPTRPGSFLARAVNYMFGY